MGFFRNIKKRFWRGFEKEIDYKTLATMVNENFGRVFIIDVRTKDEYYNGHIDGAINVPLQDVNRKIESIVRNKTDIVIMYCEYGGRSKKACAKLERMGYVNVYNLKNGIAGI